MDIRQFLVTATIALAACGNLSFARDTDVGTPREETLIVDMLNAR